MSRGQCAFITFQHPGGNPYLLPDLRSTKIGGVVGAGMDVDEVEQAVTEYIGTS